MRSNWDVTFQTGSINDFVSADLCEITAIKLYRLWVRVFLTGAAQAVLSFQSFLTCSLGTRFYINGSQVAKSMDTGKSNPGHWSILCYWNTCKTSSSMNCRVIWFLRKEKYFQHADQIKEHTWKEIPMKWTDRILQGNQLKFAKKHCIGSLNGFQLGHRYTFR